MAETFGFLEAEGAAMEVDFEQGEIDREVQAWQIAEAIQNGNLASIEAFLQASIDEGKESRKRVRSRRKSFLQSLPSTRQVSVPDGSKKNSVRLQAEG